MTETRTRQQSNDNDLFTNFQNIVHLAEDSKSYHVFVVMGASVIILLENYLCFNN
jgi:hypothetical protein